MICPRCGKGEMVLTRIEYRGNEVVYIYVCVRCGHRLELSHVLPRRVGWKKYPWWAR